jgi:hypothetical protein
MQTRANKDTREIPREEWIDFFDDFSKKHEGWIVVVEVISSELGDQEAINNLPLVGISADIRAGENRIVIIGGGRTDADVNRIINNPKRVWHKPPKRVADDAIEVESADGVTTLITFKYVPPEEADRHLPERT